MFVDEVSVFARAGSGGRGAVAFLREAFRPRGGPCGGNGGRGGSVILQADHDLNNLVAQFYQPRLIAEPGGHGLGKGMDGRAGRDLLVKVPCGTLVWSLGSESGSQKPDEGTDEDTDQERARLAAGTASRPRLPYGGRRGGLETQPQPATALTLQASGPPRGALVTDLTLHGDQFVLCRGGRGGLGNRNFATATRQAPRFAQPGESGEEGRYLLELRLMADVGLVGFPNAGKSTLLAAISKARPAIAPYPFTTLHPQVGIVEYEDWHRLMVCDVPGLIEGAHRNAGLGHAFLRHIQRCRALVILLDMAGVDGRAPWDDYAQVLRELELYDSSLLVRPRLVLANKMDETAAEANLRKFRRRVTSTQVLKVSAAFGEGLEQFKKAMRKAAG